MCQHVGVLISGPGRLVQPSDATGQTLRTPPVRDDEGVLFAAKRSKTESQLLDLVYQHVKERTGYRIVPDWHLIKIMPTDPPHGTSWRVFHSGLDVRCAAAVDEAEAELTHQYELLPPARC